MDRHNSSFDQADSLVSKTVNRKCPPFFLLILSKEHYHDLTYTACIVLLCVKNNHGEEKRKKWPLHHISFIQNL